MSINMYLHPFSSLIALALTVMLAVLTTTSADIFKMEFTLDWTST